MRLKWNRIWLSNSTLGNREISKQKTGWFQPVFLYFNNKKKRLDKASLRTGADARTRTADPLITNQ